MKKELSVGAVIYRLEKGEPYYLLLHYGGGHWDFTKGHPEKNEGEMDALRREIWEETGLTDVVFDTGFKDKIDYFFRKGKETVHKDVIFYLARTNSKDVQLSFEHVSYVWLPYDKAVKQATFESGKKLLEKVNAHLASQPKASGFKLE